ncbi:hypothetical protein [Niallia circulans]|uniref:hypothetical protein n=1 Tax=Niallia circulans TaxID=1397 RepID=UPI0026EAD1A2|nr:hypothetical protein [Niallia circulans]
MRLIIKKVNNLKSDEPTLNINVIHRIFAFENVVSFKYRTIGVSEQIMVISFTICSITTMNTYLIFGIQMRIIFNSWDLVYNLRGEAEPNSMLIYAH